MSNSNQIQSPKPAMRATLLERVSPDDAARLETIHSRMMALAQNLDVNAAREVSGFVYEILQMPVDDRAIAARLDKQYHRVFQVVGSVQTAMNAIDALDNEGQNAHLVALFSSLDLIQDTLEDIAAHLASPVVLKRDQVAS